MPLSTHLTDNQKNIPLIVHGQAVFLFSTTGPADFTFMSATTANALSVEITKNGITVISEPSGELLEDIKFTKPLDFSGTFWFSVDSQNETLYAGVGEPRLETVVYSHKYHKARAFLQSLTHITIHTSITPLKLLRDPITSSIPLLVKDMTTLTMDDVASAAFMPVANLSLTSQKMYNCIAGPMFVLNSPDFPNFYKAIERSIATPGLWCYETLKKKATEFNKDKPNPTETYLRITLGQNNGESPGIPYVMEIWPAGHFSPVHSHAGAEAVIRVLEGGIHVDLFPYLSKDVAPFGSGDFVKGNVMWISPTLNQTHQLTNTGKTTCVTIQCYMYDGSDKSHYDYFDYLDADGVVQQYQPDSDMDFIAFKNLMEDEWVGRPRSCWGKASGFA